MQQYPPVQQYTPAPQPSKNNTTKIIIIVVIVLVILLALCICGCIATGALSSIIDSMNQYQYGY
ncbi:MAG: hypothetical protein ACUVWR_09415 [Anaerolineae bacterium]